MRGLEPGGKNHSTERDRPKVENAQGVPSGITVSANGDGCLGTVKDRPAVFLHITPKCDHDADGPEVAIENGSSRSCSKCGKLSIQSDSKQ